MQEKSLDFEKSLEYQFLYNDDPNSIFLLLSWLDNKNLCNNLVPKYSVTKALLTGLRRSIRGRDDKKAIVDAINKLVSDDLNRLELAFSIKAYRKAYDDYKAIDKLERLVLRYYQPKELLHKESLFHDSKADFVDKFKSQLLNQLIKNKDIPNNEYHANLFLDNNIKSKIYRINYTMDKQVVVDYSNADILRVEGKNLSINELKHIYDKVKFYINRSLKISYVNQYWYALNDAVLSRYL